MKPFFPLYTVVALFTVALPLAAQETLPFAPAPSGPAPGVTLADSAPPKRTEVRRLAKDAPNVVVILMDDVGAGTPSTYGGEINTPTLSRVAGRGISYNRFHSTAMCSPTRASLLTGRNHTRVGNGQIAEFANGWDGFTGVIPRSSGTVAEVLKQYGYSTGAWGKWHNTPINEVSPVGPFHNWPTGLGFEYFYGFLAGESSQYEPNLVRNTQYVTPPTLHSGRYHLTEDIADDAIQWLRHQNTYTPDRPFFIYWAPGASHGPHQVPGEWADRYAGKFDDGWDAYRERVFKRQKELGWVPQSAKLTPRPEGLAAWESIPEGERPFQRRLMEVFAGFTEHADFHAGRVIEEIERQGRLENTLVFYIWGDNGSSAEGQNGTISELLAQNGIPSNVSQHIAVLEELGGLKALGSPKTENMYHAAWAWAGSTPYRSMKLVAAHFGGTRQPMAVAWPRKLKADKTPRPQFHHVIDVAPTIYEAAQITPPRVLNGVEQDALDGTSLRYTFDDAKAPGQRVTQFFDIMGSRGIYHDGWFASTFGPRTPWVMGRPDIAHWDPQNDVWQLYHIEKDWSQADDLAAQQPGKLEELKSLFLIESTRNKNLPIGGGLWTMVLHPEDMPAPPYTEWSYSGDTRRIPEALAPKLGARPTALTLEAELPEKAEGVLYSMGGFSGGLTVFLKEGRLVYEYNLFQIQRTRIETKEPLPAGKVKLEVTTRFPTGKPTGEAEVVIAANGRNVAQGKVPVTAPAGFTTFDCLDFGTDLGSPVSNLYDAQAPYPFNGKIERAHVRYLAR